MSKDFSALTADTFFSALTKEKEKQELAKIETLNEKTHQFGLALTPDESRALIAARNTSLREHKRVEFAEGILDKLIFTFCDSPYLIQEHYAATLQRLADIFYEFKNRSSDHLTDEELLTFMKEQFDTICFGDLDYLEGTVLERFSEAVRSGYRGYEQAGGKGSYEEFDEVPRWDKDLYMDVLRELFWE